MEIKFEIKCQFCGRKLDYQLEGVLENAIIRVKPCSACTDQVMDAAWKSLKSLHMETDGEA